MSVSGIVWFIIGGLMGSIIGGMVAMNVLYEREYTEPVDYYELDPVEVNTPSYEQMEEYDAYDFGEFL